MKWFKHYTSAGEDAFICSLIDEFGLKGYAYWFLLLELCASNAKDYNQSEFELHESILKRKLHLSSSRVHLFLHFSATLGKLQFKKNNYVYYLKICKWSNYKHKDSVSSKIYQDSVRARIDKNRIEYTDNKKPSSKAATDRVPYDEIMRIWNDKCGKALQSIKAINGKRQKKVRALYKLYPDLNDWEKAFQALSLDPWSTGNNPSKWKADFNWLTGNDSHFTRFLEKSGESLAARAAIKSFDNDNYERTVKDLAGDDSDE